MLRGVLKGGENDTIRVQFKNMPGIIKVTGGRKLSGEVRPIPNKNSIVAALPAALLSDKWVTFHNVPETSDVSKILLLMKLLGAVVEEQGEGEVKVNCADLKGHKVDSAIGGSFRGSLMFVGPLLARFGKAEVPMPGGCELGMRSIEAHIDVFEKVGVKVERIGDMVRFTAPKKIEKKYHVWQIEASVTATENIAMYAAGIKSEIELIDAACEPHVVDVLNLLADMGAVVSGAGSNKVVIKGEEMKEAEFTPRPDFIDIVGLIIATAITNGRVTLKGANIPDIVDGIISWMEMFNIKIERREKDLIVSVGKGGLEIDVNKKGFPLAGSNLPKLYPRPWPGFPVDAIPPMATLASKSKGRLLLMNWMYESGLDFVRELNQMGADIMVMDPRNIIVNGPVKFKGGSVTTPSVIQACKAIFLAALADPVETTITGVDILNRRYPNIFEIYNKLGAKIEIVPEVTNLKK